TPAQVCAPARDRPAALGRTASARAGPSSQASRLCLPVFPFAHLLVGVVFRAAVAFLDLAHELVTLPGKLVELVIGQLAPALLERALHLLPVPGDGVPIHVRFPWWMM